MSSTPKKYRFHSVFLFFRRRSALTFLFRHPKFLLNFFKKLLTNYFSHSMISNVSGRQIQNNLHMREWLSWWSTTLPRSGPRVRVPSRALFILTKRTVMFRKITDVAVLFSFFIWEKYKIRLIGQNVLMKTVFSH